MIKLTTLLFFITLLQVSAVSFAQKVTLNVTNAPLEKVFDNIRDQCGVDFFFSASLISKAQPVSINLKNQELNLALAAIFRNQPLTYVLKNNSVQVRAKKREKADKSGRISGKVVDDKGEPLPGATIKIIENNAVTQSAVDGSYVFIIQPGTYTLEISYVSFVMQRISGIIVTDNTNTPLDIAMKPDTRGLNEVIVTATYRQASVAGLYARQKSNAAMSDGITAEQISRTPDNNSAQVLRRVSGLQVSQNKYVVVRGLSDRYNNVLLNGNQLPSTEPNRRDFAFDVIPSSLIDNIVVNKTATPDLPGEFTGGLVQVTTKDIPETNFVVLSVGSGFNTQATGKDFIGGKRGTANYFGFANGDQKKPSGMAFTEYNVIANKINSGNTASADEKTRATQFLGGFPDNWAMRRYTAQPIQNYSLSVGQDIPFKNSRLGVIAALTYRNEQTADQFDQYYPTLQDYKGDDYVFNTLLGGSLNLGYRFAKNKFTLKNTYNRRFTDKIYKFNGVDQSNNSYVNNYSGQTLINELFQTALSGEHALGRSSIKLEYGGAISTMERDQPNSRIMSSFRANIATLPDKYYEYNFNDGSASLGSVFYSALSERRYTYQANAQLPFKLLGNNQLFKAGYQANYRKVNFGADAYRIRNFPGNITNFSGLAYTEVYNNQNFADQKLFMNPLIGSGKKLEQGAATGYRGTQKLDAFYGMLDIKPLSRLRLIGGFRLEKNLQKVKTSTQDRITNPEQVAPTIDSLIEINKTDWLPSLNVIYALTPKMNVRAAVYKTVARPDLRELSFFEYFDFDIFRNVSGSDLKPTQISNYDLRYEFYPGPDELISVSGFYKKFNNPIELTLENNSAGATYFYRNLASAKDIGFEVDVRKSLSFVNTSNFFKNLYVSGSFTWVDASVELGKAVSVDGEGKPVTTKRDRPLYGQSPYIINGGINYNGKNWGVNVIYNKYGKRIITATTANSEDEYEHPRDLLDLQVSYKFLKQRRAELRFNISDILNQNLITYKNQYGPGNSKYKERDPSVERYPGDGSAALPKDQLDPKGTSYNAPYDVVTFKRRNGSNYVLNFIYRF